MFSSCLIRNLSLRLDRYSVLGARLPGAPPCRKMVVMEESTRGEKEEEEGSSELLCRIAERQLRVLEAATNAVEAKASTFLGFEAVLLALVLGTLPPNPSDYLDVLLTYTAVALLLAGALLLVLCVYPRKHRFDPDPWALMQRYSGKPPRETRAAVAGNMADAWRDNYSVHETRAALLQWALCLAVIGLCVLVFDVFVIRVFRP